MQNGNFECGFEFCKLNVELECQASPIQRGNCIYWTQQKDVENYIKLIREVMKVESATERSLELLAKDLINNGYKIAEPITHTVTRERAMDAIITLRRFCNENAKLCADDRCFLAGFCHSDLRDEDNAPCFWLFGSDVEEKLLEEKRG